MGRGGQREGAGRKSGWKHSETQTIRVPKIFAAQVLDYARQLDSEPGILEPSLDPEPLPGISEQVDSETFSELVLAEEVSPGQTSIFDLIDSETKSKLGPLRGIDLAKRFGVDKGVPSQAKGRFKNDPQKFLEWAKGHDPDGVGWEFNLMTKLYHPVDEFCDDF